MTIGSEKVTSSQLRVSLIIIGFHSEGKVYEPIEIVDVYQMFCFLLDIEPEENDGVWDRIKALLRNDASSHSNVISSLLLISLGLALNNIAQKII